MDEKEALSKTTGKILAVDDDPTNLEVLTEIFEEDKYNIKTVSSGDDCLQVIPDFQPDVILLDIMMPGLNGYEVCRKIRKELKLPNIKIIMVSAKAMDSERLQGYHEGANDYVTKPFNHKELEAKVNVYLRIVKAENELTAVNQDLQLKVDERSARLQDTLIFLEGMIDKLNVVSDSERRE